MSEQICEPEKYSNVTCLHGCGTYTVPASEHCRVCNEIMADGVDDQAVYCSRCGHNAKTHGMWEMSDISRSCIYPTCRCLHFAASPHSGTLGIDSKYIDEELPKGAYFEKVDDIELQLLIVDFGDGCAIRIEKEIPNLDAWLDVSGSFKLPLYMRTVMTCFTPFADIRAAIDAMDEKPPVPRVTMDRDCNHTLHYYDGIKSYPVELGVLPWAAIVELAGHPLPIYEPRKGEWVNLCRPTDQQLANANAALRPGYEYTVDKAFPVQVWRYTRRAAVGL